MNDKINEDYKGAIEHCRQSEQAKFKMDEGLPEIMRKRIIEKYMAFKNEASDFLKKENEKRLKEGGKLTKEEMERLDEKLNLMIEHEEFRKKMMEDIDKYIEESQKKQSENLNK